MFKFNCSKYWQNLSLRFSQSTSFEEHYERKHEQFPSESPLYLTFGEPIVLNLQQKLDQNAFFKFNCCKYWQKLSARL